MSSAPGERTLLLRPDEQRPAEGCLWTTAWLIGSAALGYASDGYDLFNIDLVMSIIEKEYPGQMEPRHKSLTVSSCVIGVIAGQLFFGYLADVVGRRACGIACALLQVAGALLSAFCSDSLGLGMATQLALCRFILGIGVGGEFPLAGTISVEGYSSPSFKGKIMGTPFQLLVMTSIMYETGMFCASAFVLIFMSTGMTLDLVWRLSLGAGAVPASVALVLRWLMEESEALEKASAPEAALEVADEGAEGSAAGRPQPAPRPRGPLAALSEARWLRLVLAGGIGWGCMNAIIFGQGSFKSIIAAEYFGFGDSVRATVHRDAVFGLWIALAVLAGDASMMPVGDRLGCMVIAVLGFSCVAVCCLVSAISMWIWPEEAITGLMLLLTLLTAVSWGPMKVGTKSVVALNTPANVRSTCVGIAAAGGKAGALAGSALFPLAQAAHGLPAVMVGCSVVACAGVATALIGYPFNDADPRKLDAKVC